MLLGLSFLSGGVKKPARFASTTVSPSSLTLLMVHSSNSGLGPPGAMVALITATFVMLGLVSIMIAAGLGSRFGGSSGSTTSFLPSNDCEIGSIQTFGRGGGFFPFGPTWTLTTAIGKPFRTARTLVNPNFLPTTVNSGALPST